MVAIVPAVTVVVLTLNVAVVAPAATVTEVGTVAAVLLLASITTAPPAGAEALSVTVPVLFAGPVRLPGFSVIEASAGLTIDAPEAGGVRTGVGVAVGFGFGVAVGFGFGVAVGVGVGAGDTSNAPMSMRSFTTRGKPSPRWSSSSGGLKKYGSKPGSPASMAGLPLKSSCVKVGPPLS